MEDYASYPTDVRAKLRAAVAQALASGATGDQLAEVITDRVYEVADHAIVQTTTFMLGQHLKTLPEKERKAFMFDALVSMGVLDDAGKAAAPKRCSGRSS